MTPERQKELDRIYNQSRRDYFREYRKEWYKKNREKVLAVNKTWRKNNPEKIKEYKRRSNAKRRMKRNAA